jgi:hypothetical protein
MASRYAVFQYVPDPISGERVNFGVVVYSDDAVRVRFIKRWSRVRNFAGKDVAFLREFAARISESADPSMMLTDVGPVIRLNEELIQRMTERWMHSIQVTEPKASTLPVPELLKLISGRVLREASSTKEGTVPRRAAAEAAISGVRAALQEERIDLARELLQPGGVLRGELTDNKFDAVVQNGTPVLAAHGISFQKSQEAPQIAFSVNAVSFMLSDVRHRYPEMPLALVAIPPRFDVTGEYERAQQICAGLHVDVIGPDGVEGWARPVVREYFG